MQEPTKEQKKRLLQIGWDGLKTQLMQLFFDAWIIMLALGGLAHRLHTPRLSLDYFTCVLINVLAIAFIPQGIGVANYLKQIMLQGDKKDGRD